MTPERLERLTQMLDRAKADLMRRPSCAFYAHILFSMKIVWDETVSTAYTNGLVLGLSPDFFEAGTFGQRVFVLVHECDHVARMHIIRGKGYDHDIYNQAADHVINLTMKKAGFEMYDWVLCDHRFDGMATEEVYGILMAENQQMPLPPNMMADLREIGDEEESEVAGQIQDVVISAVMASKMAKDAPGTVPGEVELFLDKLLNPKLPWNVILSRYMNRLAKSGFNWAKPNRRFLQQGYYLPSRQSRNKLMDFEVFTDISGSETDEDFLRYVSELHGIITKFKPGKITLSQFDTRITQTDVVKTVEDLAKVKFHGRGGTIITEVLNRIEKTKPKLALIFSDGGFSFDRQTSKANIIWMIHDNPKWTAPFGKVIHFKTHD